MQFKVEATPATKRELKIVKRLVNRMRLLAINEAARSTIQYERIGVVDIVTGLLAVTNNAKVNNRAWFALTITKGKIAISDSCHEITRKTIKEHLKL